MIRLIMGLWLLLSSGVQAGEATAPSDSLLDALLDSPSALVADRVQDQYNFFGLAMYLNGLQYYLVTEHGLEKLVPPTRIELGVNQSLAIAGRFNVLLIQAAGLSLQIDESAIELLNPDTLLRKDISVRIVTKPELTGIAPDFNRLRYAHLWRPFAVLARAVEFALVGIHAHVVANWGLALILISILIRILLLPVTIMTERYQQRVSQIQVQLAPVLVEIKDKYDGAEAHELIMAAHKDLGVTPFYSLKPMLATMIQIPVLIAVFNALGEMPQFSGQSLWWIGDLAYPDAIANLPVSIPLLGNTLNALPFFMALVSVVAALVFQNPHASQQMVIQQRRKLYLMTAVFFILFYPFPAAMVFYWTVSTILSAIQQRLLGSKIR